MIRISKLPKNDDTFLEGYRLRPGVAKLIFLDFVGLRKLYVNYKPQRHD